MYFFYPIILLGTVFFLSYYLTDLLVSSRSSIKILDHPNERSLHSRPTPKTGGLAILGSMLLGLLFQREMDAARLIVLSAVLILGIVSFLDVKSSLPQKTRLVCHFFAALIVVFGIKLKIQTIPIPLLGDFSLGYFAVPVTLLVIVWFSNLYNFMDGMDGFAGGMAVFGFSFLGLVGLIQGHSSFAVSSFIVALSAGGFLFHNWSPAKIFMGDVGSISLGFLAGVFSLIALREGLCTLWVPVLIFSPFIADATITLFYRIVTKKKFWVAHREHSYQLLVLAGWSHRKTVSIQYLLMLMSGLSALFFDQLPTAVQLSVLVIWFAIYLTFAYFARVLGRSK